MIATIQHIDNAFFALSREFKRIAQRFLGKSPQRVNCFAAALRVLELARAAQVQRLLANGVPEGQITEAQLGFPLTWEQCVAWSDDFCSKRSFEDIFTKQLIPSRICCRFYVECHRRRTGGHETLEVVCDAEGAPILYDTIAEAREQRREGGDIINYVYFNCHFANTLIKEMRGTQIAHSPQQPSQIFQGTTPTKAPAQPTKQTQGSQHCEPTPPQRRSNTHATATKPAQPLQNCETETRKVAREAVQNCEGNPRNPASNKNNKEKEESLLKESNTISASRAIALSSFDFSQPITPDAIKQLSQIVYAPLPAQYRSEDDKEAAYAKIDKAAISLAAMPRVADLGLRQLAACMAYQADEDSPCQWREYCRQQSNNPGMVPRLWHLESETVLRKTWREMQDNGWWPGYLPRSGGVATEPAADIDLAELAGTPRHDRVGMDAETAHAVEESLTACGFDASTRCIGMRDERGYAVEIWLQCGHRWRAVRLYTAADLEIIADAGEVAPFGSEDFVENVTRAVRARRSVA